MTETAIHLDDLDGDEDTSDRALTLQEILGADNIADLLTESQLNKIGMDVVRDYEIDLTSREKEGWSKRNEATLKMAMQVREPKDTPWPNASNVKFPLLTVAAIQFQARAYPAIVDGSNLVKARVLGPDNGVPKIGPDGMPMMQPATNGVPGIGDNGGPPLEPVWETPPGEKRERGDRIANHMTWQLLYQMKGWEEDTDRMLLMLPIIGCVVRKTYHDAILGSNVSMMVPPEDFVVNYWTKSLDSAPRMTHVLRYYPYEARERIVSGIWRSVPVDSDMQDARAANDDENAQVRFYEQHRLIDLDEDGYPEPYVVITTTEGKVARIAACFSMEDVKAVQQKDGSTQIARIERQQYFTKYGFIPAPDGSFYDIGFGMLLGDIGGTINTILNQMIDAASLANSQGGFIGAGVNIKSGNTRSKLGEWKRVDVTGGTLRENIFPLNLPGPSATLFQLLGLLIDSAKEITSVQDIMTGGPGPATQTATTTMAQVEQGMKSFSAIFKRIHRAFWQELKILFRLNREYLDEQEYYALADSPGVVMRKDYQSDDLDIMPVSDPAVATDLQRMARADYLATFVGNPMVDQKEITRRRLEAGNVPQIKELMNVPPPPPDPEVLAKGAELAIRKREADTKAMIAEADAEVKRSTAAMNFANAAATMVSIGLDPDAAMLAGRAVEDAGGGLNAESVDRPGGVPAMGGPSGDEGLHGVPEGPAGAPDGGMGAGPIADAGAAGAGGDVGADGGDPVG